MTDVLPIDKDQKLARRSSSPLEWFYGPGGADVQHFVNRIHAVAETMALIDSSLVERNTICLLSGIIFDDIILVEKALKEGDAS